MRATIVHVLSLALLTACSTENTTEKSAYDIGRDSELCRRAVADQLSREQASLRMRSDIQIMAYDQRYHFCMTEKGYTLPANSERTAMSAN